MKHLYKTATTVASSLLLSVAFTPVGQGQIVPDATLPSNSIVTPNGNVMTIEGGTTAGSNLFHSFSEFSVPTGSEAFFNNATSIDNILTRVTGGNISNIDGLIRANGGANLFLLNPRGIIFGPNARLDIGGSFLGSTAESVLFEDGSLFSATEAQSKPLLTISVPLGLQMGANSGNIQVNGTGHNLSEGGFSQPLNRNDTSTGLQVSAGNTLALVGGNIALDGGILTGTDGRTELGAVSAGNLVQLKPTQWGWTLDYSEVSQFGNIQLTGQSLVEASEIGAIRVRGHNISVRDGSLFFIENRSNQAALGIDIQATEAIEFDGINHEGSIRSGAISDARDSGAGGDILIIAPRVRGQNNGGDLRALTFADGNGGNITVEADEIALIGGDRRNSDIQIRTLGAGNGGNLTINTRRLTLQNAALVSNVNSSGSGDAGSLIVNAAESVEIFQKVGDGILTTLIGSSAVSASGNAGNITINTPRLTIVNRAAISSSTFGEGNAGTITVNGTEFIKISGFTLDPTTDTIEPATIRTAGVLLPEAIRQLLGLPDNVTGSGGEIILNTPLLEVTDGARVTVRHEDIGNGGTLRVNAEKVILQEGGSLTASTQSGDGGNIILQVQDLLQLRNSSLIDTEAFGEGNGGNITIKATNLVALQDSDIIANAVRGQGGNILITTQGLFLSPDSDITATSEFGLDGVVEINNPDLEATTLVKLPENVIDPSNQLRDGCAAVVGSSFVVTGRGGLPPNPSEQLRGSRPWADIREIGEFRGSSIQSREVEPVGKSERAIVEANRWIVRSDGTIELVFDPQVHQAQLQAAIVRCNGTPSNTLRDN